MKRMIRLPIVASSLVILLLACSGKEDRLTSHIEKAGQYYALQDFEKARIEYQNVLQIDPKNIPARFALGQTLEKLDNPRQAVGQYMAVVENDPTHLEAKSKLARLYFLGRATDQAMVLVTEILQSQPGNADALAVRAGIEAQQGHLQDALLDAEAALAMDPDHLDTIFLLASLYQQKDQPGQAIESVKKAIARHKENASLRQVLAQLYVTTGNSEAAIAVLKENIAINPDELAHRLLLARFLVSLKNVDAAEAVLREAIAHTPDAAEPKLAFADFLTSQRDRESAAAQLRTFIEENQDMHALRFGLARLYLTDEKKEEARAVLENIITLDQLGPDGLKARTQLAMILLQEQKINEAESLLGEVLAENAKDNDALILRGNIALSRNDPMSAIADFRSVLRDQPVATAVMKQLARAHIMNKEPDLAMDNLKKVVELEPKDAQANYQLAQLYLESGKPDQTLQQVNTLLDQQPKHVGALELNFKAHMLKHDVAAAHKVAERTKEAYPDQALGYYFAGIAYQAENKLAESTKELEFAVARAPDAIEPINALVRAYLTQKQIDKAEQSLRKTIAGSSGNAVAHNLLGEVLMLKKEFSSAGQAFTGAIKNNPTLITPYKNLASVHVALKDIDAARNTLSQGIEATGGAPDLMVAMASLYEQSGDVDSAIAQYEKILNQHPESQMATNNIAMLLATYKSDDAASLSKAGQLVDKLQHSENPAYLDTIGWVRYKQGNMDEAIDYLTKALAIVPDEPMLHYHLGIARYRKGEFAEARENLQKAVASEARFSGLDEAKQTLAQMEGS